MKYEGITELHIDRMVDGELSAKEQRELLLACETDDRWRELALAYVESQVLGNALGESTFLMADAVSDETPIAKGEPIPSESAQPTEREQRAGVHERRGSHAAPRHWHTLSLAAAVLISLGIGSGLGWWWQGVNPGTPSNVAESLSEPNKTQLAQGSNQQPSGKSAVETMPFWVTDSNGSELRQVALPLVNASDLGPNWQQELRQPDLPPDLVEELRDRGMKLRQQRTMIRARRADGRLVLVPIDYFYEELFQ